MEKVIKEYYCDYCGEKCEHTDFVVPEKVSMEARDKHGILLKTLKGQIKGVQKDICSECQEKIVALLGLMESAI